MAYSRALLVPIVGVVTLAAFYAGVAPALQPLFDFLGAFGAAQSDAIDRGSILGQIRFIVFVLGPMIFLLATLLFPVVFALRRERFVGGR